MNIKCEQCKKRLYGLDCLEREWVGSGYPQSGNVVASDLGRYISYYLKDEVKRSEYEYDSWKGTKIASEAGRIEYVVGIYRKYFAYIERIVRSLEFEMTREELDYVIWSDCKKRQIQEGFAKGGCYVLLLR